MNTKKQVVSARNDRVAKGWLIAASIVVLIGTQQASAGGLEWILLVDTSKSMGGLVSGSQNIFGDVQRSLKEFIRTSGVGDTFYIYTFDTGPQLRSIIPIVDAGNRATLAGIFDDPVFRPNGDCTHIGDAIIAGFKQAASLQAAGKKYVVVLFTDGMETCEVSAATRLAALEINKFEVMPHTFYVVWLGEPLLEATLRQQFPEALRENLSVLIRPRASKIASLSNQLRGEFPPSLTTKAAAVDLGVVRPGRNAKPSQLTVVASKDAAVRLSLSGEEFSELRLTGLPEPVRLRAGENKIAITIAVPASVPAGTHKGAIEIRSAEDATVSDVDADSPLLAITASVVVSRSWLPEEWLLLLSVLLTFLSLTLGITLRRLHQRAKPHSTSANAIVSPRSSQYPEHAEHSRNELRAINARALDQMLSELQRINAAIEDLTAEARSSEQRLTELIGRRDQLAVRMRETEAALKVPPVRH